MTTQEKLISIGRKVRIKKEETIPGMEEFLSDDQKSFQISEDSLNRMFASDLLELQKEIRRRTTK